MQQLKLRQFTCAAISAGLALASGHAVSQGAYATAYNNIYNLSISTFDENELNGPVFIPLDNFTDFTVISATNATLNGMIDPANAPNSDFTGGPSDAQPAFGLNSVFPGATPGNNQMAPQPPGGEYARGDAQVSSTTIKQDVIGGPIEISLPFTGTQAWVVADTYIASEGFANASSRNASQTGFNTTITLNQPAVLHINFDAMPYARVFIDAGAAGGAANANLETTFSITSGGTTVFEWSPNGRNGSIFPAEGPLPGGTDEIRDDLPLNGSIEVTAPGDEAEFYEGSTDPVPPPLPPLGVIAPPTPPPGVGQPNDPNDGTGRYSVRTQVLPPGVYTLSLDMLDFVNVVTAPAAPIFDWGDNPDTGAGTGSGNYQTTQSDGGPVHEIGGPYLGACVDADDGSLQDANSLADDNDSASGLALGSCTADDDEDGVTLPAQVQRGASAQLSIQMPVLGTGNDCAVDGWIDFNADGDYLDAGEKVVTQTFAAGSGANVVAFSVPGGAALGTTYARFRCSSAGSLGPTGAAPDGEVEDYLITIIDTPPQPELDYGDNPDTGTGTGEGNYRTTETDGGPSHTITGPYLGLCVDADNGTLQNATATADDSATGNAAGTCNNNDDEDGVTLPTQVLAGESYLLALQMPVQGSGEACFVDGWMDFNRDGDFNDAGEKVVERLVSPFSGANPVTFTVPEAVTVGDLYARFRCSSRGGLGPTGAVDNGEVEDYRIRMTVQTDERMVPIMGPMGLGILAAMLAATAALRRRWLV